MRREHSGFEEEEEAAAEGEEEDEEEEVDVEKDKEKQFMIIPIRMESGTERLRRRNAPAREGW